MGRKTGVKRSARATLAMITTLPAAGFIHEAIAFHNDYQLQEARWRTQFS
jgi:hypothetical protein